MVISSYRQSLANHFLLPFCLKETCRYDLLSELIFPGLSQNHWPSLREWGLVLQFRTLWRSVGEWREWTAKCCIECSCGLTCWNLRWCPSPSTRATGPTCEKPTCQLLNDQVTQFTKLTNLTTCVYIFIKTWAIDIVWVCRACKGSGESRTMVPENNPTGSMQEPVGGATGQIVMPIG